jgi:hypothetical protein
MQALISRAKVDYAAVTDSTEFSSIHAALIADVSELERAQAADFFSIAPGASVPPVGEVGDTRDQARRH